jgi:hypothetical protein
MHAPAPVCKTGFRFPSEKRRLWHENCISLRHGASARSSGFPLAGALDKKVIRKKSFEQGDEYVD